MVKRLTAVFCGLWCVMLIHFMFVQWNSGADGQEVVSVFAQMGLKETGAYLEMTGSMGHLSTEKKAINKLEKAARQLGIDPETSVIKEQKSNGTIWTIQGESDLPGMEDGYWITAKVLAVKDGFFVEYYLQVRAEGKADAAALGIVREQMAVIKERERLDCIISMRLNGSWNRILGEEEKTAVCNRFLEAAGTQMTGQNTDRNLWMVYAYGKQLGEAITVDQELINLNLMFRDSQDETRCFVGVPAVWSDDFSALE